MRYETNGVPQSSGLGLIIGGTALGLFLLFGGVGGCMYFMPQYKVYKQRLAGEAELAQANYSKQVAVQEALAKKNSAADLADAEIARARGVATANKIIGDSLKNNPDYLTYLWIDMMKDTKNQVIYVPTEASVPVTEASRFTPAPVQVQQ